MKTLTRIFLIVIVFFAINLKETMAVTMSITNASWQSTVDQDNDGYRRSGILRLNVTSDVGVYCTIKIKYTVNNGSVVYLYYQTPGGTLIPAGNSYFDFEIGTSATGGELPHNLYDFIIQIVDWPAGTTVYASRSYSNDSDLNDELFETAAEDQGAQNFNCIPDIEYIQINGTTIPNSSTTNISLNSLNDSFLVRLRGQNIGSDNAPADLSNLTISFQQYTSASDKNLVIVNSSTASDLTVNKLYGAEAQGGDGYADYVIVEANDNNGWNAGESNSMYLDVKAKQWGQFIIEFRMGLPTNNTWVDFVHDPAAGYCPNCYEWDTGIDPIKFISFWIIVNVSQITWPDLVIQNQSVSPSSTNVGATVLSSCTIANIGNGTAGESEVKYYLSSDIYLDDNDHYFSSDFVPQLIAGGSGSMTESLTIPESTVPGSYYILFVADADNEVVESNEDNNVSNAGLVINACNLTVSPTSLSFTSSAGSQNVSVTSNSTWNVTDDASWITVSPTSGSNNGSITVTVTENTGAQRTGTVTVTATCGTVQNITVTQAAPCNLTVSPTSLSFTSSAGSQNVSVTSNSTWNVTDDASWITVSPTSGSNNGSITVTVTENTGAQRTGTVTVTATCGTVQNITVTQAAPCNLTVSPTSLSFTSSAGSQNVSVTSNSTWNVTDDASWITVSPTSGSNNGSITVTVTENTGAQRTGTVTVTATCGTVQNITVTQAAPCNLTVSPTSLSFTSSAGSQNVSVTSNSTWNVTDDASWITVSPTSGSNNGSITVTVTENTGAQRTGTVTVTATCGTVQNITVTQAAPCNLTVSPTSLSFTSSAGSQNVSVTSNSTWNVTDDASWITVSPTSGSNNGSITVTVTENTGAQRTGTVTVTATCGTVQNITVTQAAPCNLTVSPTSLSFTSSAGSQNVSVTSNSTWNVTDDASWITVSPTSGSNNGSITVTVTENTGAQRTGTVTVTATCGTVQNITVTQAAPCNLTVSPTSLSFTSSAGSQNVSVTSNSTWNVTDDASWITVSPTSGSNNGSITVSVTSNTGAERTGTITVTTTCGTFQTIAVMQEGISTQNLLYLKRGNPSSWTTPEQPGSQWREIQTWENSGYTVTTIDFLSVTINTSLLSNYSTVRINGNNGDRPITSSEGQALYQWVQSGGNLFAEIPYTNMVPGVSLFGVQTINGQNGGSNGTSWHFNGAPWVIGPVFGPTSTIEEFASECMDKPALTSNHNFEIDATISGYPAIVHKSYGSEYENTKKVIIVFAQGWSHDASYPGNAFRANIYQGDNLAFLSNCIDYFQFAVGNEVIKIDNYPYVRISPNPVNSKAILSLSIQESERVTMEIIDINGNKLWILLNNKQIAVGEHEFEINCEHLATGLYFVKVTTEKFVAVEKLLKH